MRLPILICALLFCLAANLGAGDDTTFKIRVSVMSADPQPEVIGSGEFSIPDNRYGRVAVALYQDERDFFVKALGSTQQPITFLLDETKKTSASEIDMLIDLYLRPTIGSDRNIEIDGTLNKMERAGGRMPAGFTYTEDILYFSIPNGGEHRLSVTSQSSGRNIILLITAFTSDSLVEIAVDRPPAVFETGYSLYNQDDEKYEIENHTCRLGEEIDDGSTSYQCTVRKQFPLGDEKFVDYAITYRLERTGGEGDQSLLLNFYADRRYTMKTQKKNWLGKTVTTTKIVETSFSKAVTTELGEQLEIKIPADKSSELPFDAWEKIVITYPAGFVGIDKTPIPINKALPKYPGEARKQGISGDVLVQAFVDKEGRVKSARAVECNRPGFGFEEAAVEAALKCLYKPALQKDKPVGVWITYKVIFKLD